MKRKQTEKIIILPDYSRVDDFVEEFSRLMRYLSVFGVAWSCTRVQILWVRFLILFMAVSCIYHAVILTRESEGIIVKAFAIYKYVQVVVTLLLLERFRMSWPSVIRSWISANSIEKLLPKDQGIRRKIRHTFLIFTFLFSLDRFMSILTSASSVNFSFWEISKKYMKSLRIPVTDNTSKIGAITLTMADFMIRVILNINYFILVSFGIGLSSKQRRLNTLVRGMCERHTDNYNKFMDFEEYNNKYPIQTPWRKIREAFVSYARLVEKVDEAIGPLTFLAGLFNLFLLTSQLAFGYNTDIKSSLLSLNWLLSTLICATDIKFSLRVKNVLWFAYNITMLFGRNFYILTHVTNVHDMSMDILQPLNEVNTNTFNTEVRRLHFQLNKSEIALTGMGFFKIKRDIMLKALAVVGTYVLVILQYNDRLSRKS